MYSSGTFLKKKNLKLNINSITYKKEMKQKQNKKQQKKNI